MHIAQLPSATFSYLQQLAGNVIACATMAVKRALNSYELQPVVTEFIIRILGRQIRLHEAELL